MYPRTLASLVLLASLSFPADSARGKSSTQIQFDLAPVAAAEPANDDSLVTVRLRLSSMIETPDARRPDQWIVRCQPRDPALSLFDYAPRTETASDLASPIQISESTEKNDVFGLSVSGATGPMLSGTAGADHSRKNVSSSQFQRVAPVQAVTASGTINRGTGVYFKLRWTAQQVLEGEKEFVLTFSAPRSWRAGLMDVSVVAQAQRDSFVGWERETVPLAKADFVVAVFRADDADARRLAHRLSECELQLRELAVQAHQESRGGINAWTSMLQSVGIGPSQITAKDWLHRLLSGEADPHLDKEIAKLPMPLRLAVLDYAEARHQIARLTRRPDTRKEQRTSASRIFAAKPALAQP